MSEEEDETPPTLLQPHTTFAAEEVIETESERRSAADSATAIVTDSAKIKARKVMSTSQTSRLASAITKQQRPMTSASAISLNVSTIEPPDRVDSSRTDSLTTANSSTAVRASMPGAFPQGGGLRDDSLTTYDTENATLTTDEEQLSHVGETPYVVNARLVSPGDDDGEELKVAVAVKDTRQRRLYLVVFLLFLVVIAIVLGVSIPMSKKSKTSERLRTVAPSMSSMPSTSVSPSLAPSGRPSSSSAPTAGVFTQIGQDLNGLWTTAHAGAAVALSDDGRIVAMGAPGTTVFGFGKLGKVQVFQQRQGGSGDWEQRGEDIDGLAAGDRAGAGVALSGDGSMLAVLYSNETSAFVQVFAYYEQSWFQLGGSVVGGADSGKDSIALSREGTTLAVGSRLNSIVNVYSYNGFSNSWVQVGNTMSGRLDQDDFGNAVALSGNGRMIAIGAPGTINGGGAEGGEDESPRNGYAHVYRLSEDDSSWMKRGLELPGEVVGDEAGFAVALSRDGDTVAVSSILNDHSGENAGMVKVYTFNEGNNVWLPLGNGIYGEAAFDNSGFSLGISSDGRTLAIGAPGNKGRPPESSDKENANAGHVRIYQFDADRDDWQQRGLDIDGEDLGDTSGQAVALSGDGNIVAIGGPFNSGVGKRDSGQVQMFRIPR